MGLDTAGDLLDIDIDDVMDDVSRKPPPGPGAPQSDEFSRATDELLEGQLGDAGFADAFGAADVAF